ncbi:MAG TPA: AGE family epimerase/isomerase [Candidatus Aminicenantes bacterium]|nr:AGE family epimerase/isomerase [Candidatus Aminicenantes bacterium]
MSAPLLRPLRGLLTPPRAPGFRQRTVLRLWDGYAALASSLCGFRDRSPGDVPPSGGTAEYLAEFFRRHAAESLLPFWRKHSPDPECGGFFTLLDRRGGVLEDGGKSTAMQGRMVYGLTLGASLSGDPVYLDLARQGVDFLIRHGWDGRHGGWVQNLTRAGGVLHPGKHSFTQAFVMLGLAEYARASGEARALDWAERTYALAERHLWDERHGGYFESGESDWRPGSTDKTVCIQLDMMIAAMALAAATRRPAYAARARELASLVRDRMRDPGRGGILERFSADWGYRPVPSRDQLWIGHCLKAAWLLLELDLLTGNREFRPLADELVDFCLNRGWDPRHGGFFQYVFRNGRVARGEKVWWTQCEGIQALLLRQALDGKTGPGDRFRRLADFSFSHFADAEFGEWFTSCRADGTVRDDRKGGAWKAAYHTVQMCHAAATYLGRPGGRLGIFAPGAGGVRP